jgi:hypothetical protein
MIGHKHCHRVSTHLQLINIIIIIIIITGAAAPPPRPDNQALTHTRDDERSYSQVSSFVRRTNSSRKNPQRILVFAKSGASRSSDSVGSYLRHWS